MDQDLQQNTETSPEQGSAPEAPAETPPEAAPEGVETPAPVGDDFAEPSAALDGKDAAAGLEVAGMDLLMDVHMEMTVELGRARLSIGEIMELSQGSVIELDKMAGEPVDLRINGVLLAQGEVIVMDDVFGVRITRLNQRIDRNLLGR